MTKFSKNFLLIILSLLFVVCTISFFAITNNQAHAGEIYTSLVSEEFSKGSLDTKTWYNRGRFDGVSFESTGNPKLVVKEGQGALDGSGINGKVAINANDKVTFTIDIEELYFGARAKTSDCGWFALAYNLSAADYKTANAYRVGQGLIQGDGICFTYTQEVEPGLVFTSLAGGAKFVDKNGNEIQQKGIYAYYPINDELINDEESPAVLNTKLVIIVDKDGNFACYKNEVSNSNLLFKSVMSPFKNGTYYGLTVHRSATAIERTVIKDFEVKCDNNVINSFNKSNENKWSFYKQNETPEADFSPKYYMHIGQNGTKVFTEEYPLFLSKEIIFNEGEGSYAEFFTTFKVNTIPTGSKVGFLTGSKNYLKDKVGSKNTTFVYTTNVGGENYLGVTTYDNNGTPTELLGVNDNVKVDEKPNVFGDLKGYADLYVNISETGEITILLNGSKVYASTEQEANCYASGYCGIAVEGSATNMDVAFSNITVKNSYYSRPTNINVYETFDNNGYNPNEFYFRQAPYLNNYTNTGGYVKDGKLWFDNLAFNTSFTTVYQYSDFEIQFDIDDIRREPVGVGNSKSYPISAFIGVYWGVPDSTSLFSDGVSTAYPLIYIATEVSEETWGKVGPTRIFAMGNGLNSCVALPDKYDYWDTKNEGKVLQFKVTTCGNKVSVAVRYTTDEEGYWCTEDANGKPLTFTMREALVGNLAVTTMGNNYYVEPHSVGSSCGYFSLDNLKITNKDVNGNLTNSEKGTTYKELPTDFPYVKPDNDDDYLPEVGGSGCSSSALESSLSIIVMVAIAVTSILFIRRRKHD